MPTLPPATLVMVPCFSGAPWALNSFTHLQAQPMQTMQLPGELDNIEDLADFVQAQTQHLSRYVLVGDSFGAVISLALAARQPKGLQALVLSGGFAKNPITSPLLKLLANLAPWFPGPFYRAATLRVHAANLSSPFDHESAERWTSAKTHQLFVQTTPHRDFVNRIQAVARADYGPVLRHIQVPTLVLTPEHDRLIGKLAAGQLLRGIANCHEVVLRRTGHMFRFTHPVAYSLAVSEFLSHALPPG